MQFKKLKALNLFLALSLIFCLAAAGIVTHSSTTSAETSSLLWTQIPIPEEADMELQPETDIGPMAVSSDNSVLFASVWNESSGNWTLVKSLDRAYTWQDCSLSDAMAAIGDNGDIVSIKLSPSWNSDGRLYVATKNRVYLSQDRGRSFDALTPVPGTVYASGAYNITSLAVDLDLYGRITVAVGTRDPTAAVGGDVYILNEGIWDSQSVGAYDVLTMELSPNYAMDATIIAVCTDASKTVVRTKVNTGAWGVTVPDATIKDAASGLDFVSYRACLGLPGYFKAAGSGGRLTYFVGLSVAGSRGDVFRIDGVWLYGSPTITDLDVRGNASATGHTETNIWSMALSTGEPEITLIAGTEALNTSAVPVPHGQFLAYLSSDSGLNWIPRNSNYLTCKQPTGETKATVVMTPSYAYLGTYGNQSAVSFASLDVGGFNSWSQHGLIDTYIDEITDMSPSEAYYSNNMLYITTQDTANGDASLWRTETEGLNWDRLYCSSLMGNSSLYSFNTVRLIYDAVILAQRNGTTVVPSSDNGMTFRFDLWNPAIGSTPAPITAFAVSNASVFYAGDANGSVRVWTDDSGTWTAYDTTAIPTSDKIIDLNYKEGRLTAGTDRGGVFFSHSDDMEFHQLGRRFGGVGDEVSVHWNLYDENFIFAGVKGGASAQGIWRYDATEEYSVEWEGAWDHVATGGDVGDISSIGGDEEDGVLYAISSSLGIGWRCVDPGTIQDDFVFEEISKGLGSNDSVRRCLRVVSDPTVIFAVGGSSYTQIWTTSDQMVKVKLLAPEDDEMVGMITEDQAYLGRALVFLEWKEVEDADLYEVQIAFDEAMDSPVHISYYADNITTSSGMVKVAYPWLGTRYYWRVRVIQPYTSQWSKIWSFTTPLGPSACIPVLRSPLPGQEGVSLRPALAWNSSIAATAYELILAMNCDWEHPVLNLSGENAISDTAYQLTFNLEKDTNYCWKVRGINAITRSPWSDALSFTTGETVWVEEPGLPTWIWVIIGLGAVLMLSILVLIIQSRRY